MCDFFGKGQCFGFEGENVKESRIGKCNKRGNNHNIILRHKHRKGPFPISSLSHLCIRFERNRNLQRCAILNKLNNWQKVQSFDIFIDFPAGCVNGRTVGLEFSHRRFIAEDNFQQLGGKGKTYNLSNKTPPNAKCPQLSLLFAYLAILTALDFVTK